MIEHFSTGGNSSLSSSNIPGSNDENEQEADNHEKNIHQTGDDSYQSNNDSESPNSSSADSGMQEMLSVSITTDENSFDMYSLSSTNNFSDSNNTTNIENLESEYDRILQPYFREMKYRYCTALVAPRLSCPFCKNLHIESKHMMLTFLDLTHKLFKHIGDILRVHQSRIPNEHIDYELKNT
ncbi:hypothetical protein GJ496_008931 [Pomphorhynchus laevis]|nr:hypothetical protein GJ496_008931 [Pomphorhynchus laevis]